MSALLSVAVPSSLMTSEDVKLMLANVVERDVDVEWKSGVMAFRMIADELMR